jgi:hypothetical protein
VFGSPAPHALGHRGAILDRMKYDLLFGRLLLIYQMPKTGSQTVEATLQQCPLPHRILRFHFLGPYMTDRIRELMRLRPVGDAWSQSAQQQLDLAAKLSRAIRWRKILCSAGVRLPKLEVITGVRELIGLGLSSVFQNQQCFAETEAGPTLETCRDLMLRPRMFTALENWFDWELKSHLGIDVYQTPFPRAKGYAIYENRLARVLLYRVEAMRQISAMLREFLGCDIPTTITRNVGREKDYSKQYAFMQENLRFLPAFVAGKYDTKMMKHFYSVEERKAFELKWREEPAPAQRLASSSAKGLLANSPEGRGSEALAGIG